MDEYLQQFVSDNLYVAGLRNVDPVNPVTLAKYSPQETTFLVTIGYLEPSFSQLPYNLLWIPYDKDHTMYGKVLRRTSNSPDGDYKYTWEIVQSMEDLWSQEQYYENIADVDTHIAGVSWSSVTEATNLKNGLVILKDPQVEQRVIHTLDPRLSDKRVPTAHDHPDFARTMMHIKGTYEEDLAYDDKVGDTEEFVKLISAKPPIAGQVFFLIGFDVTRPNMWYGEWRKPAAKDVNWIVPRLMQLPINLPAGVTQVEDNKSTDLGVTAIYSNGDENIEPLGVRWSVSENSLGVTINANTGMLFVPDIDADATITVTAEMTDPNDAENIVQGTLEISLLDSYQAPTVIGFEIQGPTEAQADDTEQYFFIALMSDETEQQVRASTASVDKGASINTDGVLTVPVISEDTTYTITATYDNEGTILTATYEVFVEYVPTAGSLVLSGAQSVIENSDHDYVLTLNFTDGTEEVVTPETFITDHNLSSVSAQTVTYGNFPTDDTVNLTATYTYLGEELTATLAVSVGADVLVIEGADYMDEGQTESYVVKLKHTDGTEDIVTPTTFTSSETGLTISGLDVTAIDTQGITEANLTATLNTGAEVLSATHTINLGQSTLTLTGPALINERGTGAFVLTLIDGQGNETQVNPTTITSNINSLTFDVLLGSLDNILTDVTATVTATYMNGTEELTASVDVPLKADRLVIQGATSIEGGATETYVVLLQLAGGGESIITPDSITSSTTDITLSGLDATAADNASDGTATLTANYNDGAGNMTATIELTIIEGLFYETATIEGPSSFPMDVSQTYQVRMHDNKGGSKLVSLTNPVIVSASPLATFLDSDTVRVDGTDLTNDYAFTFKGDGTWEGTTLTTEDFTATALYQAPELVSLLLEGPFVIDSDGAPVTANYTVTAKYDDDSEVDVTPLQLLWTKPTIATADANAKTLTVPNKIYAAETGLLTAKGITGYTEMESNALSVRIDPATNPIVDINILGPDSITEGTDEYYELEVTYESGSKEKLTTNALYEITVGSSYVESAIKTSDGRYTITAGSIDQNRSITLKGTHYLDSSLTVNKVIGLINVAEPATPVSLAIIGVPSVNEDTTTKYTFRVTFSDNTTTLVSPDFTALSINTPGYSFGSDGNLTVPSVSEETVVTLSASHSIQGHPEMNATLDVTINNNVDDIASIDVTSVTPIPNPYYYGDGAVQLRAIATHDSGATTDITNIGYWYFPSPIQEGRATLSATGLFQPDATNEGNTDFTPRCAVDQATSSTKFGSMVVRVSDRPKPVIRIEIEGDPEVFEGDTAAYSLYKVYDDNTRDLVSVTNWSSSVGGTFSSNNFTAPDVTGDTPTVISANWSSFTATYDVTIKDTPVAAYGPRFGAIPRITSLAGFDAAFAESLDRPLAGVDGDIMQVQPFDSELSANTYVYLMYPKDLGFIYAEQLDAQDNVEYTGGIDGAKNWDDGTFDFTGAAEITIDNVDYYVYRNDFSYENLAPKFRLTYGSASTMSGNR